MIIDNIEHIDCAENPSNFDDCRVESVRFSSDRAILLSTTATKGAAAAFADGNTFATYGFADADGFGAGQGQFSATRIDTNARATVGHGLAFSQGFARVDAVAIDPHSYARANFNSLSTFTGAKGSTNSRKLTMSVQYSTGR